MIYTLPETVKLGDKEYPINSDFRCILDVLEILADNDLTDRERAKYALGFFYKDLQSIPGELAQEAVNQLYLFINGGQSRKEDQKQKKVMDWQQDYPLIIGAVNRVIGHEIRNDAHLHWWTFLAAYMEIGDCLFSQVIKVRQQIAEGRFFSKASKAEKDWYKKNRDIVDLHNASKYTDAELAFMASLK